jgi:DNA mismatch repair protein MutS2
VPQELMMLGKRAEEVESMLNKYLDDASLSALTQVRIVHGSGTGVLRQIVRDMLHSHPLVKSFRPGEKGEGGNGVTIVRLGK